LKGAENREDVMKRILVIEDEAIILLGLVNLLQQNGFEAISAKNGSEGIRLAIEQMPDLILCNVNMPKLTGYQVFKELRNNQITAAIPFLFLTAQNLQAELNKNPLLELSKYLTKPYDPEELLQLVAQMLGI
jgi:CheY-like chemotaxis protein